MGGYRSVWSPAKGQGKGGIAILVGERYEDKTLGSGVDEKNKYVWIKLVTPLGEIEIVNVYVPQKPEKRAKVWDRMSQTM